MSCQYYLYLLYLYDGIISLRLITGFVIRLT